MDAFDAVRTKLDIREFDSSKKVPKDVKLKVLDAGRLTGSGINAQHWRFILVQDPKLVKQVADDSTTGKWAKSCNFAVILLTDPKLGFHQIDAGRALQDMQIAAWNYGIASGIFTGMEKAKLKKDFGIPDELDPTVVIAFGFPADKITGKKKNRKSISEIAFLDKYGNKLEPSLVS